MLAPRWRIRRQDVTVSTNDDARRAAETGTPEGFVITAERQLAGRGRQGRSWDSPAGNLYFSALLRPKNLSQLAGLYSFVVALAIQDAVRGFLPQAELTLKWPNDVLVRGRKISGILLEVSGDALILGVGLNVVKHPEDTLYPATSLAREGAIVDLPDLLDATLDRLGHWHDLIQSKGFAPIRMAWLENAQRGALTVGLPHEVVSGTFVGIDEKGHLRLLLEGGTERSISTGDVLFMPKV